MRQRPGSQSQRRAAAQERFGGTHLGIVSRGLMVNAIVNLHSALYSFDEKIRGILATLSITPLCAHKKRPLSTFARLPPYNPGLPCPT
ncbi:hypothetical protein DES53_11323 [Roseimicrobium gellanilyticum]|uniref:Uncharacterized protein n=1 Tax=Roseimicrobium gellanilyticum TaxID=748857 RepID=A0A366H8E7_9BACT|nr:hypothetical protein DES53_11323 [Roseimicrobium gellanilyticum]